MDRITGRQLYTAARKVHDAAGTDVEARATREFQNLFVRASTPVKLMTTTRIYFDRRGRYYR